MRAPAGVQGVDQFTGYVELPLFESGIAEPDRSTVGVARQPRQFQFAQSAFAVQLSRVASGGAQQPLTEGGGFVAVAGMQQRVQGKRRVADPAETVVPVAHAAETLR